MLFSYSVMSDCLRPHRLQHTTTGFHVLHYLPEFAQIHVIVLVMHPTISSSVSPFSSCPQSLQASGSSPVSWLFITSCQSIETSALASVLPMNIQGWIQISCFGRWLFTTSATWEAWRIQWKLSCLTLCDSVDCSLPGSSIHGIFQARVLE